PGPGAAEWVGHALERLSTLRPTRTDPEEGASLPDDLPLPRIHGDSPRALGLDHGRRLREPIRDLLRAADASFVAEAERSGRLGELVIPALATGLSSKAPVVA